MNPWTKIRELMDAVPEEARRLIAYDAWDPAVGCGCIFGTLYPYTPRPSAQPTRINFVNLAYNTPGPDADGFSPETADRFRKWLKANDLSDNVVSDLQTANDAYDQDVPEEHWKRVYAYVVQREKEFTA